MPPIKIYTNAPLHPEGITPKTAGPVSDEKETVPQPTRTTATTTSAVALDSSLPPPPQPGARPQPGPAPTSTFSSSSNPAPPQPGAAPSATYPSITAVHTTTTTSQLPPPPQMSIPAPTSNQAPTHSTYIPPTSVYESGASAIPDSPARTGGFGRARAPTLEHPPGYMQNPYAADGTAADRARFDEAIRQAVEDEGMVGSVKQWVQGASEKLGKLEDEAWKWAKGKS